MQRALGLVGICGSALALAWGCGAQFTSDAATSASSSAAQTGSGGASAATGSGGGQTGTGGTGCSSADADKDGKSICAGDCNDADPTVYPGAPEICGDGVANNCMGMGDPASCNGKGTFVAQAMGSDTNPGTKQKPLLTIAAGMKNAAALANQPVFVAEGSYKETNSPSPPNFQLVEGISLLGGFHCQQGDCPWTRSLAKPSKAIIQASDAAGVYVGHQITVKTLVEGFTIAGQDGNPGDNASLTALFVQGSPEIRSNRIVGGNVTGGGSRGSVAIVVTGGPAAVNENALIRKNDAWGGPSTGSSIGVAVTGAGRADLVGNDLRGGSGIFTRGLQITGSAGAVKVIGNAMASGTCLAGGTSFGLTVGVGASPLIDGNRINADPAAIGSCTSCGAGWWCGGIESAGSQAKIVNNLVYGILTNRGAGILLTDCEGSCSFGSPIVNSNTIDGGGLGNGLSAGIVFKAQKDNEKVIVGKVRNNIILAGSSTTRFCGFEEAPATSAAKPEKFENNDLYAPGAAALYWSVSGGQGTPVPDINTINMAGGANNISADPQIDATGHIGKSSPCVNAGSNNEAPATDIDGETRPKGGKYDIGADEAG